MTKTKKAETRFSDFIDGAAHIVDQAAIEKNLPIKELPSEAIKKVQRARILTNSSVVLNKVGDLYIDFRSLGFSEIESRFKLRGLFLEMLNHVLNGTELKASRHLEPSPKIIPTDEKFQTEEQRQRIKETTPGPIKLLNGDDSEHQAVS